MMNSSFNQCNNIVKTSGNGEALITTYETLKLLIRSASTWYILWRLFHIAVGIEQCQLILNAGQRIWEVTVVKRLNCLMNPSKQVRCQGFVVCNHFVIFTALVKHLKQPNFQPLSLVN